MSKMTLSEELKWRGFINQTTLNNITELDKKKWVFYHGFDASADSQTVGNLAGMMLDKVFMRHGAKAYILAGGATSLIGDPGGKDVERPLQDEETVAQNIKRAEKQLKLIFKDNDFTLVNNLDWIKNLSVIEFLRDIGKHFSMTPLVQRDYIAQRMGKDGAGISFTEFSYTLLQGYDFLHLHQNHEVNLQLAGSDQWGNCLSGVELVRKVTGDEVHAITMSLIINKSTGKKFGKSEAGAVWLDEAKTSVYQFYQFWLNVDDDSVGDYLKIYTELDKSSIALIMAEFEGDRKNRHGQKTLAYEVTKLVHGKDKADSVKRATETLFGGSDYANLTLSDIHMLKNELYTSSAKVGQTSLIDILVNSGLAGSNTEARRYLAEGGIYINGTKVPAEKSTLTDEDNIHGHAVIRRGKNAQAIVQLSN
jgi:tyrosyl-tRNA synthetase